MGVVYMAEQEKPVRRRVALKIIKPGMDTGQVIARFEAERQALALMDHQNIAKVLDAGATDTGRPYFVMELVKGVSITEYCDRNLLTLKERLELFIPVCQAIQHAHQKGIIHRDIKPSNVLVTLSDGEPVAKVIDFGVAKATDQRLTEKTMFTQFGQIIGTLEYMSPEQAEMGALDIDTRSDIYSLGVVFYELLTGSTPLQRARIRRAAYVEILRRIREEETPKPSTRLSDSNNALATISVQRKSEPARLARLVRGELDWIVMKALEKDRTRRYDTANGLARDIQRYLDGDPVEAGPQSATYRLRKFARKHRVALIVAGAFAGLLVVGVVVSTILAIRARTAEAGTKLALGRVTEEERKARQSAAESQAVLNFFQEKVLAATRPETQEGGLGKDATIRMAVDAAEPKIAAAFLDQPAAEASIRHSMGLTYLYLGEPALSITQLERTRQLRHETLGADHPNTLANQNDLAVAYLQAGRLSEAVPLFEEALKVQKAKLGPDHEGTLATMNDLAYAYREAGRLSDAMQLSEATLKLQRAKHGPDHPSTLMTMYNLGVAYKQASRLSDAIPLFEETLKLQNARLGPDHPDTLMTMNQLGSAYLTANRLDDALPLLEMTLKVKKAKLGLEHHNTISSMSTLASAYWDAGRWTEALPLYEETLRRYNAKLGANHLYTQIGMMNLAAAYRDIGRLSEAVQLFEETLKLQKAKVGLDHISSLMTMYHLAVTFQTAGRLGDALPLLELTYRTSKAKLGPIHFHTLRTMNSLAEVYLESSRLADAESLLRESLAIRRNAEPDNWTTFDTCSLLGAVLSGQKKYAEAEPLIIQGYEGMKAREAKISAPYKIRLTNAGERVLSLYEAWGQTEKAREWRKKLSLKSTELPSDVFAR
jgi:eukaryotic-like serine/threonine-protein kinase